jgi:hypothetical protein
MMTFNSDISDVITRLLHAIDAQDWAAVRDTLADRVETDYTSLFGGAPQGQPAEELIASWKGLVPGFDATQHLTGPILSDVSGAEGRAYCAVTAVHRLGDASWTVSGHYDIEVSRAGDGWRIRAIRYRHVLTVGDTTLPAQAQERLRSRA